MTRVESGQKRKKDEMPYFPGLNEVKASQNVPSTFTEIVRSAESRIDQGEILKPTLEFSEYGNNF